MTDEKKQKQKLKAKERCIKILNIGSYICTALLILILVLAGCQSCGNKTANGVSAESPIQVENLAQTTWQFNDNIKIPSQPVLYNYNIHFTLASGTGATQISWYTDDQDFYLEYPSMEEDALAYYWDGRDGYWSGESYKRITFYEGISGYNYTNVNIINFLLENATLVAPLNTFTFNKSYNYNAPLGLNVGITGLPFLNDLAWVKTTDVVLPSTATETTAKLYLLPFYANGVLYNCIHSHFEITRATRQLYTEDKEGNVQQVNANLPVFTYLEFAYYDAGTITDSTQPLYANVVNIRDTTQAEYGGNAVNVYKITTTWVNDGYRYLNFGGYVVSGDTSTQLRAFNNNNELVVYTDDSDLTDTFTLLGGVFTAIVPILSIKILPYVSIGLLVFIPLVVGIILFIIDKIKK